MNDKIYKTRSRVRQYKELVHKVIIPPPKARKQEKASNGIKNVREQQKGKERGGKRKTPNISRNHLATPGFQSSINPTTNTTVIPLPVY